MVNTIIINNHHTIGIIGRTNSGKSSLINVLTKKKLAAVSKTVNTTRKAIIGLYKEQNNNWLLLDSPGVCQVKNTLDRILLKNLTIVVENSDLIWWMVEIGEKWKKDLQILQKLLTDSKLPIILVINKIDKVNKTILWNYIEIIKNKVANCQAIVPISVQKKINLIRLLKLTQNELKKIPQKKPNDQFNINNRDFIGEVIREQIIFQTRDELPHETAVKIVSVQEKNTKTQIEAEIIVNRPKQKMIILGKNGNKIKIIRINSTKILCHILHKYINLHLQVKVIEKWFQKSNVIKDLNLIN